MFSQPNGVYYKTSGVLRNRLHVLEAGRTESPPPACRDSAGSWLPSRDKAGQELRARAPEPTRLSLQPGSAPGVLWP